MYYTVRGVMLWYIVIGLKKTNVKEFKRLQNLINCSKDLGGYLNETRS